MVKCAVSGCPNREEEFGSGVFIRTQKRFFRFPADPARVKVWLAALRQTDRPNPSDQNLICEDHFLPEDVGSDEVGADAIPIMPACLDGPLGLPDPWDEDQWAAGSDEDEDAGSLPFNTELAPTEPPAPDPTEQNPGLRAAAAEPTISSARHHHQNQSPAKTREDVSLPVLTRRFLDLILAAPNGSLDLRTAISSLRTRRRRVYDITNVLQGIRLIEKETVNRIRWIGSSPVSSYLDQNRARSTLPELKLAEETLDCLIRIGAEQLYSLTDDPQNSTLAYVTHGDLQQLRCFQNQTLMAVKAPQGTRLDVPSPTQDHIQIHLKGGAGPILVVTCDLGAAEESGESSGCFSGLEESRVRTAELHTGPHKVVRNT